MTDIPASNIIPIQSSDLTPQSSIASIIDLFISESDIRPSSKDRYRKSLVQYFQWIEKNGIDLSAITRTEILRFKEDLLASGLAALTVGAYLTTVRIFYEWAESHKIYPNVAKGIKNPKRQNKFIKQHLTAEQCVKLLEHLRGKSKRDFALVNLLLRTGIRTIEAARAKVEDISQKFDRRILHILGKGRDDKSEFVILEDKAYFPISEYLASRGAILPSEPIFISTSSNYKGSLTTKTISSIVKAGLKAIGLDGHEYTAHSLRHTAAVLMLKSGAKMERLQSVLRHHNIATTQIYTESIKEEERFKDAPEGLINDLF
ncbi:MAG: hypothetical protein UT21_C0006G0019 [Candidatus Woesebacteria bacterium GW2011_GWA1_39_11b]|nr:MAG: hypothetical protein UT21_C0006G0019 [Candidatus Woesebacteria bacterium GW2011_GWA1_39_11b]KKS77097.1 MAG: hypothetical protein UV51_C0010G0002 [Candidatus Woesebacteria bacterium GW2011_GWC1_42_9]